VVTAQGDLVTANASENADLFWGIRGGGGNFGIVTSFDFRCAEIGTEVYAGLIVKKFEDAGKYLQFHREYVRTLPDEMTVWLMMRHAPALPFLPKDAHGTLVVLVPFAWLGDPSKGEDLVRPIREATESLGEDAGMIPWTRWQSTFDDLALHGARNYWKSHYLGDLPDTCIDRIITFAGMMPSDDCEVFIPHMEGAPVRVSPMDTAYAYREMPFVLNIHTRWRKASDDGKCIEWAKEFHRATREFAHGVYVNFLGPESESRVREAYTPDTWDRLVEIKNRWDPENLFRLNQNIRPAE
jgi:FAD/FMN-containing dehydrogenase